MLLERGRKEGMAEKRKAMQEAKEKPHEMIRTMLRDNRFSISDIAKFTQTSEDEVLR